MNIEYLIQDYWFAFLLLLIAITEVIYIKLVKTQALADTIDLIILKGVSLFAASMLITVSLIIIEAIMNNANKINWYYITIPTLVVLYYGINVYIGKRISNKNIFD